MQPSGSNLGYGRRLGFGTGEIPANAQDRAYREHCGASDALPGNKSVYGEAIHHQDEPDKRKKHSQ